MRSMRLASLTAGERLLVGLWLAVGVVLWNGVYDMMLGEAIKEYLFRSALYEAGRAPHVAIATVIDPGIDRAVRVASLWAAVVVLAGLVTIHVLRRERTNTGHGPHRGA